MEGYQPTKLFDNDKIDAFYDELGAERSLLAALVNIIVY